MDKKEFGSIMNVYLTNFRLENKIEYVALMHKLLTANGVELSVFKRAVYKIIKNSNDEYFDKYKGKTLSFADWLLACGYKEQTENDELAIAKRNFLKKLDDRITGFQADFMKKEFNDSLTENESQALNYIGGASDCWTRVNREEYSTNKSTVLREAGKAFEDVFKLEKNILMIEKNNLNKEAQQLVGSFVKKLN